MTDQELIKALRHCDKTQLCTDSSLYAKAAGRIEQLSKDNTDLDNKLSESFSVHLMEIIERKDKKIAELEAKVEANDIRCHGCPARHKTLNIIHEHDRLIEDLISVCEEPNPIKCMMLLKKWRGLEGHYENT